MTVVEAIERCNRLIDGMSVNNSTCDAFRDEEKGYPTFKKMTEFAEECKSALEKQIAKKPIEGSFGVQCCPCCNEKVGQRVTRTLYENRMNYCWNCGVRIDWGNEDAE